MANLFLDANFVIDIAERQVKIILENLKDHLVYISPLSLHILAYSYKYQIPYEKFTLLVRHFHLVDFSNHIVENSLRGPTSDFEDNVQLHSATEGECDLFLTSDRKLLDMKFFGKMQVVDRL
ncbi:MAG: type II toxin-antitoxin system VapC family toxin [Patescibacteria group bacterium]